MASSQSRRRLPERDENVDLINRIVDQIIADRTIIKVDALVDRFNLGKRTLQRIFSQYVGVSPKWVIRRYRIYEAAGRAAEGVDVNWADLAADLGYSDQAHLTREFTAAVGLPPAAYARRCAASLAALESV